MHQHFVSFHRFVRDRSKELGIVALFMSMGIGAFDTVWGLYLKSHFQSDATVGLIAGIIAFVVFLEYIFFVPLIIKFSEKFLWNVGALSMMIGYGLFYFDVSVYLFIAAVLFLVSGDVLYRTTLGIMLRDVSKKKDLNRNEGMVGTLRNVGWLLSPLIAGFFAAHFGIPFVFILAACFALIGLLIFNQLGLKDYKHKTKGGSAIRGSLEGFKLIFSRAPLRKLYFLLGGMGLFWGILYLYTPLLIVQNGLPTYWVGIFLAGIIIPLISLEYLVGIWTDRFGFKLFFVAGYFIMTIGVLIAYTAPTVYLMLLFLVLACIGAAMIENTTEAYFFKIVKKSEEERLYGPFRTAVIVFNSSGKLISAFLLIFATLKYVYVLLAFELSLLLLVAITVKEHRSKR